MYIVEVEGEKGSVRSPFQWKDGVRTACAKRNMGLEEAKEICLNRELWRKSVDGVPDGFCGRRHTLIRCEKRLGASSVSPPKRVETCWGGLGATYLWKTD